MTNLEIIEAALNRLDPEREFREALLYKIAAEMAYSVTTNKHPETLEKQLLEKFPSGNVPLAENFSVTDYSTQNRYARGLFNCDGQQVGQETAPSADGPWNKTPEAE